MPAKNQINGLCKACKRGRLRPVTRPRQVANNTPSTSTRVLVEDEITHLVCRVCEKRHRFSPKGTTLQDLVEARSPDFKNPALCPASCPSCNGNTFKHYARESAEDFLPHVQLIGDNALSQEIVMACETCLVIVWVEPSPIERAAKSPRGQHAAALGVAASKRLLDLGFSN